MANEYLRRKPTGSGNRRRWTVAFWMKNSDPTQGYTAIMGAGKPSPDNIYNELWYNGSQIGLNLDDSNNTLDNYTVTANPILRDPNSWRHVVVSFTDHGDTTRTRTKFYINGALVDNDNDTSLETNELSFLNHVEYIHYIGSRVQQSAGTNTFDAQYFDIYMVDGQTLTPDVFGFNREGTGYYSVASQWQSPGTKAYSTDFRTGQWCPYLPKRIKTYIEKRGGFGANGFYLPMNDSSNPGADFHCTPNTIVKLKGEDLPQPHSGLPTTSDSFVSQLREEIGGLGFAGVVKFDGASDWLQIPDSNDFDMGTGDFTLETYVFSQNNSNYQGIFGSYDYDNAAVLLQIDNQGRLRFVNPNNLDQTGTTSIWNDEWHHIAMVKTGSILKGFVDGKQEIALTYNSAINWGHSNNAITIGVVDRNDYPGQYDLKGYLSNLRLTKGTALYTSDFTPPTGPLTVLTNTKLLCCNSSTSATASTITPGTITANNNVFATTSELTGSIVLAVPFISVPTGSNLLTPATTGTFENSGAWSLSGPAAPTISTARKKLIFDGTSGNGFAQRAESPAVLTQGNAYIVKFTMTRTAGTLQVRLGNSAYSTTYIENGTHSITIKCGNVPTESVFFFGNNFEGTVDDVSIHLQDTIRDYSADIRGTGTNKTVDVKGTFSVGECPSYYGSALLCASGTDGYAEVASNAEFADLADGDHTIEFWYKNDAWDGSYLPHHSFIGLRHSNSNAPWRFVFTDKNTAEDGIQLFGTNGFSTTDQSLNNDWNHCAVEQCTYSDSIKTTVYLNGAAAGETDGSVGDPTYQGSTGPIIIGTDPRSANLGDSYSFNGQIQDVRIYKGVAKYKGSFDVVKPYTPVGNAQSDTGWGQPVGFGNWRTTSDTSRNNFATLNPLIGIGTVAGDNLANLTAGNLYYGLSNQSMAPATMGVTSGKWYAEFMCVGGDGTFSSNIGVAGNKFHGNNYEGTAYGGAGSEGMSYIRMSDSAGVTKNYNASSTNTITLPYEPGDIIGVTIDADLKEFKYYRNGTLFFTDTGAQNYNNKTFFYTPFRTNDGANPIGSGWSDVIANFGQNPSFCGHETAGTESDDNGKGLFRYDPPTGFLALCTDNLPAPAIPDPGKHFKAVLYRGDDSKGRKIDVGFKPDLVWVKARNAAVSHCVMDSIRGYDMHYTNSNGSGSQSGTLYLSGFGNNGFDLDDGANSGGNTGWRDYVAWCWKAGGVAVKNNDGDDESLVSANREAGFSIVRSTSAGTIGHGLNSTPQFIITKRDMATSSWSVQHHEMMTSATGKILMDQNAGVVASSTTYMFDADATTFKSVFGTDASIHYCWHEVEGYSRFGSYLGNANSDGPFCWCGFRPAFVLIKNTSSGEWCIWDSSRSPYNEMQDALRPNTSAVETDGFQLDFVSNGFKVRDTEGSLSGSGQLIFFAAFAELPYKTVNAR